MKSEPQIDRMVHAFDVLLAKLSSLSRYYGHYVSQKYICMGLLVNSG